MARPRKYSGRHIPSRSEVLRVPRSGHHWLVRGQLFQLMFCVYLHYSCHWRYARAYVSNCEMLYTHVGTYAGDAGNWQLHTDVHDVDQGGCGEDVSGQADTQNLSFSRSCSPKYCGTRRRHAVVLARDGGCPSAPQRLSAMCGPENLRTYVFTFELHPLCVRTHCSRRHSGQGGSAVQMAKRARRRRGGKRGCKRGADGQWLRSMGVWRRMKGMG